MLFFRALAALCLAGSSLAAPSGDQQLLADRSQDIVTWDEHSLFVKGERVLFYSGEFHPFRLPSPGLWLDVFQKVKALGYNGVSFYTSWNLHEGTQGTFRAEGIFGYDDFFDAASQAGIYLLARPGPYINAEISGGGFPGWLTRINGQLRTRDAAYLNATNLYVQSISKILAPHQITNGGPIILLQPENEYTYGTDYVKPFPDKLYFSTVEKQYRDAGIVVPFMSNDAAPKGYFAENTGLGGLGQGLDIYGHDSYPLGFECGKPYEWPAGKLNTNFHQLHLEQAPKTPYSIPEFQGGSFDAWGGFGFEKCAILLNDQFERVFYKNLVSFGITMYNQYMIFGGTNWGNIGHPRGYTSYDYAAVISESRQIGREKYSEAKLIANFLQASPDYLVAEPGNLTTSTYTNTSDLTVTPLFTKDAGFFVLRHSDYSSTQSTPYKLTLPTSKGNLTLPQIGGSLTLSGRDSKIHVANYGVGEELLLYSTAEIFTWKSSPTRSILIVYGGPNEQHELAFVNKPDAKQSDGPTVKIETLDDATVINWTVNKDRSLIQIGNSTYLYIVDRNTAYNFWTLPSQKGDVVLEAGYLVRNVTVSEDKIDLVGDVNATSAIQLVFGAPEPLKSLTWNGKDLKFQQDDKGAVSAQVEYQKPTYSLPSLKDLAWKYIDSLPEIQPAYDDKDWRNADLKETPNIQHKNLSTPTSLYASDYGFHTGPLIYRGHFSSLGNESKFQVQTQGGLAYGHSVWLDDQFLGSWAGIGIEQNHTSTFTLPKVQSGRNYVLTLVCDHTGLDENYNAGDSGGSGDAGTKSPRGVLSYDLSGRPQDAISWKVTGNLGGEEYKDISRGPLNEAGTFAERQGYHLPNVPTGSWKSGKPTEGIDRAGIGYFYSSFDLDLPSGYDIPLSVAFSNTSTTDVTAYRTQLFVNGYQFGKYFNHIGPQLEYPIPEGIINHRGTNYIGLTLWAQDAKGAKIEDIQLKATAEVQTGYGAVKAAPQEPYRKRDGAY